MLAIIILIFTNNSHVFRCLKKYCVCFNAGVKCDDSCRCKNCENREVGEEEILTNEVTGDTEVKVKGKSEAIVEEPPTKYVKVASMGSRVATTSPITDSSDESLDTLPYPPQQQQDAIQMHNIILGDFVYGRESNQYQYAPAQGVVESNLTAEV